jgi:hypothetical protein
MKPHVAYLRNMRPIEISWHEISPGVYVDAETSMPVRVVGLVTVKHYESRQEVSYLLVEFVK